MKKKKYIFQILEIKALDFQLLKALFCIMLFVYLYSKQCRFLKITAFSKYLQFVGGSIIQEI